MWRKCLFFILFFCLTNSQIALTDPPIQTFDKIEVWPGNKVELFSSNFPRLPPANLWQTVAIYSPPGSMILLECPFIAQEQNCSQYNMTIISSVANDPMTVCGTALGHQVWSMADELRLFFFTGSNGEGSFFCETWSQWIPNGTIPAYITDLSQDLSPEPSLEIGPKGLTCQCGWAKPADTVNRIIGGEETRINEYPMAISIIELLDDGVNYSRFCGGTIISTRHVITAAHCTDKYVKENTVFRLRVIAGDHDWTKWDETPSNQMILVVQVVQHESYDPTVIEYDIAIMFLGVSLNFNDDIGPACLPLQPLDLEGQFIKGLGWGRVSVPGDQSNVLKKISLRVWPLELCSNKFQFMSKLGQDKHQMCLYDHRGSLCQGDSGGPLLWLDPGTNRLTLVGLTSFGTAHCSKFHPGVVTDVTRLLPWIERTIIGTLIHPVCTAAKL